MALPSLNTTFSGEEFLLTATAAGRILGLSAAGVVALANRGKLRCVRDSSRRRLFSGNDIGKLRSARALQLANANRRRSKKIA